MTRNASSPAKNLSGFKKRFSIDDVRMMPGALLKFIATGEDTGGLFAKFEAKALPGFEPPPHTHQHEDETYYILEGEAWFKVGDKEFTARRGDFVFLPRQIQHDFKIKSDMLHCLVGLYPAGVEQYFIEMTSPAPSLDIPPVATEPPPPEFMEKMAKLNERFGIAYGEG